MLGYIYFFHAKNIQLLLKAATKHFLWNIGIAFESKDLKLTKVVNKCLKRTKIPQLNEPNWVLKDEMILCPLCYMVNISSCLS